MSDSLDADQDQCSVGPDLGPNCLQRLSADNTSRRRVKTIRMETVYHSGVFIIVKMWRMHHENNCVQGHWN